MRSIIYALVATVCVSFASLTAQAADDDVVGAWRGSMEHQRPDGRTQNVYLRVNFTGENGKFSASLSSYQIGFQQDVELDGLDANNIEFNVTLSGVSGRLSAKAENNEMTGSVTTASGTRALRLVKVFPKVDQDTVLYQGQLVEFEDGEKLVLAPSQWTLNTFELDSRRHRVYFPTSDNTFVAGSTSLVPAPSESYLTVEQSNEGPRIVLERNGESKTGRFSESIIQEEIEFANGDTVLKGLLVRPLGGQKKAPGIVVVWGSGEQNRFGYSGLPYFRAVWFALQGYAAVVYDKRGIGESGGSYDDRTFESLAHDMVAAVDYLAARPEVDADRVGVLTHSQSGIYAPIALKASDRIKYAVVIATTIVNAEIQEIVRTRQQLEADGWPNSDVIDAEATQILKFYYAMNRIGWDAYIQSYERVKDRPWFGNIVGSPSEKSASGWDFWRDTNAYEPSEHWSSIERPLFFLYGDHDPINPVQRNLELLDQAFAGERSRYAKTKLYENADHSLFIANEGGLMEESVLSEYHPYMEDILAWVESLN